MRVVLDSSAVLALLFDEPGGEVVADALGGAIISAVNLQEVYEKLIASKFPIRKIEELVAQFELEIVPHDEASALKAAILAQSTDRYGRSLGDRSCMSLAIQEGVPVLTADKEWSKVVAEGLNIVFIR